MAHRKVLGWLAHSTFTACLGATVGYTRHTRSPWRKGRVSSARLPARRQAASAVIREFLANEVSNGIVLVDESFCCGIHFNAPGANARGSSRHWMN